MLLTISAIPAQGTDDDYFCSHDDKAKVTTDQARQNLRH